MTKNSLKKLSIVFLLMISFLLIFADGIKVFSQEYGEGNYCLSVNAAYSDGFSASNIKSIKVNGNTWASADDRFNANSVDGNIWTIEVIAGMNGEDYPDISLPGDRDSYLTFSAVPNPNNTAAANDDFIFTIVLNDNWQGKGNKSQNSCGFWELQFKAGPPITNPVHNVTSNVNINIIGSELEYHYVENSDVADVTYFKFDINGGTGEGQGDENLVPFRFNNAEYHYNNGVAPKNVDSVNTINPIEYTYRYDDSGVVEFCVNGGGTDEYTSILINDVEYSQYAPHTQSAYWEHYDGYAQMFCIPSVPYSETYNVVVHGEHTSDDNKIPGFGWSYLSADRSEGVSPEEEGNFAHGYLEFVSASINIDNQNLVFNSQNDFNNYKYHNSEHGHIFHFSSGNKNYPEENRRLAWGEAHMPFGTTLRVRIVPDEGYQLTGLAVSANGFQATDTPGEYEITLSRTNLSYDDDLNQFNLNPTFTQVGASATADSNNVSNVEVTIVGGDNAFQNGTPKLEVTDVVSMGEDRRNEFESRAEDGGYTINNYLEIDLYNTLYKGGKMDGQEYQAWNTKVHSLESNATVTLELDEALEGNEVALVHEIRNDQEEIVNYEVINGTYDSSNNTLTFETNGFSTYAVMYKGDAPASATHTVTFREEDETEISHVTVNHDETVARPNDPEPHYDWQNFEGWYTNKSFDTEFDFEHTHITEDISIYALWSGGYGSAEFEVRFDSIGGTPVDTQLVEPDGYATEPTPVPVKDGYVLEGWYLDDEFLQKFDFANTKITDNIDLMAHWVRDIQNPENYTVTDTAGNKIEFVEEAGNSYTLNIVDFMSLSKEVVMAMASISEEEYNAYMSSTANATKQYGDLIGMYGIEVVDNATNGNISDGPLTIRLKLTDEMKKYKNLKLIYVDEGNGFKTQTPISLTVDGDYAVGTLKHLSFYALTGSNDSNPKTGDNILLYLFGALIGLSGLLFALVKHSKK